MDLRRSWPTLGLVALLVLDLVLVVWAVWPTSRPAVATPTPGASATASPSGSATPSASETAADGTDAVPAPRPLTRLVVPVGADVVWAVDVGSCAKPGTVHVSDDRGKTWQSHRAQGSVTRVRPDGRSTAFVVGGTSRCESRLWATNDGGASWNGPRSAAAAWGRSPRDPRLVLRPGADPVTPCSGRSPVLDLVALDASNASVLCGDGELRRTTDGGSGWSTELTAEGAVALALGSPRTGVLASVTTGCDGVVVGVVGGGKVSKERCVDGVQPEPGRVALGVAGSGVWLAAGDAVWRAAEPGAAFQRVSDWPTD